MKRNKPYEGITQRPSNYYLLSGQAQRQIDKALGVRFGLGGNVRSRPDPDYWNRPVHVVKVPGGLTGLYDDTDIQGLVDLYESHGYLLTGTTARTLGGTVLTFTKDTTAQAERTAPS